MYIKTYKDLIVWQKSVELVRHVYVLTNKFPDTELYGIILQIRRAAISIPSNMRKVMVGVRGKNISVPA